MKTHLEQLGWTQKELCRRLGLHRNTPRKWKEPPQYVMAYLELAVLYRKNTHEREYKLSEESGVIYYMNVNGGLVNIAVIQPGHREEGQMICDLLNI